MKAGDMVVIRERIPEHIRDQHEHWGEFHGKVGLVLELTKRLYIPAASILVLGEVAEFDLDELEVVDEDH